MFLRLRVMNRSAATGAVLIVSVAVLAVHGGCASAPTTAAPAALAFPAPNIGPGSPALDRNANRDIDKGWEALQSGRIAAVRADLDPIDHSPTARLLALQAAVVANVRDPIPDLRELTTTLPGYAAAWLTLSVAAENARDEALSLAAADRGAELWPDRRWVDRSRELHQRWVGNRIDSAQNLLDNGNPAAALDTLSPALKLEPANRDAVLMEARALVALGEPDRAEAVISGLPRDPEVVKIAGHIAESRGDFTAALRIYSSLPDDLEAVLLAIAIAENQNDWLSAMNLYPLLPDNQPEKASGLYRAKLRWRISVMPDYVREALISTEINRGQLAVVLVTTAPKVESLAGGQVPLLSDIMTLPSQNEILTATRLGLIGSDRYLHRFDPEQTATPDEVRIALDNLGRLLEVEGPRWCLPNVEIENCTELEEPITGETVAALVIGMAVQEAE
jgi:tetratricopeptide (TPR) repeat protein